MKSLKLTIIGLLSIVGCHIQCKQFIKFNNSTGLELIIILTGCPKPRVYNIKPDETVKVAMSDYTIEEKVDLDQTQLIKDFAICTQSSPIEVCNIQKSIKTGESMVFASRMFQETCNVRIMESNGVKTLDLTLNPYTLKIEKEQMRGFHIVPTLKADDSTDLTNYIIYKD